MNNSVFYTGVVFLSIKAVIFDVDGTLLNTYHDLANAVNHALRQCGFPEHPAEKYKMFAGNGTDMMLIRALPESSRDEETLKRVRELYFEFYNAHTGECTRPYDGIPELLAELKAKGLKLGVVSNKVDFMTRIVIKEYFGDIFDCVTGQKEGVPAKPDPAMVFEVMKTLGVDPTECVFVGDSGVDAKTGKNSGAFMVGVLWGFRDEKELKENGANAVIRKPEQLLGYII